ncbi:Diacylglycerol O-acyltransferase 1 [Desmophyllum pertusum]|uniref:diacylglycerol O-acyltransferase n=1 Tax=Desmophyllum pertusum TaxID=174260 RepID=A0A9W9YSG9_9CNID|nr:Diacylglycerol O-acyltransferase 1 [Desmophyllum pertusum]
MSSPTLRKRSTPKRVDKSVETKSKTKTIDYGRPVHKFEESLLTSTSGFDNYRGLVNLCLILLILSNFRVAFENVLKYGVLIDPLQITKIFLEDPYRWPSASLVLFSNVFIQLTFFTEKLLAARKISERLGRYLEIFVLLSMLIVACTVVLVFHPPPWAALIAVAWYTVIWLKLISYISVNMWYRMGIMKQDGQVSNGKPETANLVMFPKKLKHRRVSMNVT